MSTSEENLGLLTEKLYARADAKLKESLRVAFAGTLTALNGSTIVPGLRSMTVDSVLSVVTDHEALEIIKNHLFEQQKDRHRKEEVKAFLKSADSLQDQLDELRGDLNNTCCGS